MNHYKGLRMRQEHANIEVDGQTTTALAPVIVSASRSTDIPAFYSEWLLHRLHEGYVKWVNPFNGVPSYVSFARTRLFVFWSKNPKPLIPFLAEFDKRGVSYYFQYTLNDYVDEGLEPGVPPLDERIDTFIDLARRIGRERVIWRFDPLILTDRLTPDALLGKLKAIGDRLQTHTARLVISFADISIYEKVRRNMAGSNIAYREFDPEAMRAVARGLMRLNETWGFKMGTCSEEIDLSEYGIEHNRCVDDRLIASLFRKDRKLMEFIGCRQQEDDLFASANTQPAYDYGKIKDKGQRKACGCIISKDIGSYDTCPHLCVYCYANASAESAMARYREHKAHPLAACLCDR